MRSEDPDSHQDREGLGCGFEILANKSWVASRDPQECNRRPFRLPAPLLPISKRVDADPDGEGKLLLREADECPQCGDVLTGLETALDKSSPKSARDGARELLVGQLGNFFTHAR